MIKIGRKDLTSELSPRCHTGELVYLKNCLDWGIKLQKGDINLVRGNLIRKRITRM